MLVAMFVMSAVRFGAAESGSKFVIALFSCVLAAIICFCGSCNCCHIHKTLKCNRKSLLL